MRIPPYVFSYSTRTQDHPQGRLLDFRDSRSLSHACEVETAGIQVLLDLCFRDCDVNLFALLDIADIKVTLSVAVLMDGVARLSEIAVGSCDSMPGNVGGLLSH